MAGGQLGRGRRARRHLPCHAARRRAGDTRRAYAQVLRRMVAEFGAGTVLGDISVGQLAGQLRPR